MTWEKNLLAVAVFIFIPSLFVFIISLIEVIDSVTDTSSIKGRYSESGEEKSKWVFIGSLISLIISATTTFICGRRAKKEGKIEEYLDFILKKMFSFGIFFLSWIIPVLSWSLNLYSLASSVIFSIIIADEISVNLPWIYYLYGAGDEKKKLEALWGTNQANRVFGGTYYCFSIFFLLICLAMARGCIWLHKKMSNSSLSKDFGGKIPSIKGIIKHYAWQFLTFEWLYFALSIAGIFLAIQYPKTGAFVSIVSTVEQRINEKAKDWFERIQEKEEGLDANSSMNRIKRLEGVVVSTSYSLLGKKKGEETIEKDSNLEILQNKVNQLVKKINQLSSTEEINEDISEIKIKVV